MAARVFHAAVVALAVLAGCSDERARPAQKAIQKTHAGELKAIVADDVTRHLRGVEKVAQRVVPGFAVEDPETRERQMRAALRRLTKAPRGVPELIASPRNFTAAIAADGTVVATDAKDENDRMTGVNLKPVFEVVRRALAGQTHYGIEQFPGLKPGVKGNVSLLFAAPASKDGEVVGAVLTGIPLWRLSQRLGKQLQLDHAHEQGAVLWVYVYRGDALHHFGTPPDLDGVVPDAAARAAGLARSPGGFTGELIQFGRWYAYGVLPLKRLGPDTGVVIFRSDPV